VLDKYSDNVKLVFKNFPLSNHKFAVKAARAALAANKQGKFWEFHHKLYENYNALNDSKIQDIARELRLDSEKFSRDVESPDVRNLISRDIQNGRQAGVRSIPSIFINGKILKNRSFQYFQKMIESELKK
jgi:protein-disulfide isomerase